MGGVGFPPRMDQATGATWLCDQLKEKTPFLAGKIGTSELDVLLFYISMRIPTSIASYPALLRKNITVNAGVFPATDKSLDEWAHHMLTAVLPALDCVAEWNPAQPLQESLLIQRVCPAETKRCVLRSLEPYYEGEEANRWSMYLPSRVAVVSPFAPSIAKQWTRRDDVWKHRVLWNPTTDILPVRCGYNPILTDADAANAWPSSIGTWQEAVAAMVEGVVATGATVVLLGCGALSLPIGAELKRRGVAAIHMGGGTQILFGIKGRRWTTHSVISTFFNDAWTSPTAEEIPTRCTAVEGGCYW